MTPADARGDAELGARLAATPMREPAPEQVRQWQAVLRELPAPRRHGHWASGPLWSGGPVDRASGELSEADPDLSTAGSAALDEFTDAGPESSTRAALGHNACLGEGLYPSLPPASRVEAETAEIAEATAREWPPGNFAPIPDTLGQDSTGPGSSTRSLRAAVEGLPAADETIFVERSGAAAGGSATPGDGPIEPSGPPSSKVLRLITRSARSTPLSSDPNGSPLDAAKSPEIGISVTRGLAAMAAGPLTTADATVATAKIRRAGARLRVAAAITGVAAAITAVAVLGPSSVVHPPSAAMSGRSPEGPAATSAGWPGGPTADPRTSRPTDAPVAGPTGIPSRTADRPAPPTEPGSDSEPLALSRGQLRAVPPTGRDLGPLAAPSDLAACLTRFGSAGQPVAARRVVLDGRPGVLLVLPTDLPGRLRLLVVDPRCTTALSDEVTGR